MTRQILLHIGSPKCGSTYLQRVMLQNAPNLAALGLAYPHDGGSHPGNAAQLADLDEDALAALFGDAETLILSHEDLFATAKRAEPLISRAVATGIAVRVVAFLRPFPEFIFSDYSQFMKQHFETWLVSRDPYRGQSFEEFALNRARRLQPATYFKQWNRLVPGLTVASHLQISEQIETLLGNPGLDWSVHRDLTNPSLRTEDCERIAAVLRDPGWSEDEIRAMFSEAAQNVYSPDSARTAMRRDWIERLFARQNAELLDLFGYDNRTRA